MTAIKKILYLLFGEWNGVQNLFALPVWIFLFDKPSLVQWIINLVSVQRFYLPLFFYVIFLVYLIFIMIKGIVHWKSSHTPLHGVVTPSLWKDLLIPLIINLHKGLLGFLILMVLGYVTKGALAFIYNVHISLFNFFFVSVRVFFIVGILYTYSFLEVGIPLLRKGHSFERTQNYYGLYFIHRWKRVMWVFISQLAWIFASILIFRFLIGLLQDIVSNGALWPQGKPLLLIFQNGDQAWQFGINMALLLLDFLISNLLYSPFILLLKSGFHRLKITLQG